jgi:hypothetical protein
MSIIGNIQNNIVVIYEIESFYVTLAAGKFFPNNWEKPIILPYYRWVVLCTVKDLSFYAVITGVSNCSEHVLICHLFGVWFWWFMTTWSLGLTILFEHVFETFLGLKDARKPHAKMSKQRVKTEQEKEKRRHHRMNRRSLTYKSRCNRRTTWCTGSNPRYRRMNRRSII